MYYLYVLVLRSRGVSTVFYNTKFTKQQIIIRVRGVCYQTLYHVMIFRMADASAMFTGWR